MGADGSTRAARRNVVPRELVRVQIPMWTLRAYVMVLLRMGFFFDNVLVAVAVVEGTGMIEWKVRKRRHVMKMKWHYYYYYYYYYAMMMPHGARARAALF